MSLKVVVLACVAVVALCDKAPVHAPHPPVYAPRPSYHAPAPYHAPEPTYDAPKPAYHNPEPAYHAPEPTYHAPEPAYHAPEPAYNAPKHYENEYPDVHPKYNYNYGVADGYSGANFGHSESRDGYKTEGSYTVDLPDGQNKSRNILISTTTQGGPTTTSVWSQESEIVLTVDTKDITPFSSNAYQGLDNYFFRL
ncbi:extensin-2-like [Penaeus chinensis]|uniref:extensin-2-like n=1 Tax=Penaeus chinensis TaxID=139456 RepID=UPI001FB78191|nr:extensin-2-like [Penaeus chinensis]